MQLNTEDNQEKKIMVQNQEKNVMVQTREGKKCMVE